MGRLTDTRSRARGAIPGSGTGTPASRRSSGGASSRRGRGRSWRACWPPSGRTASSATRSSGTGRSRCRGCSSTTSPRAAPSRPGRSSRRCWPGPGGSPSATRRRSRGSPPRLDWLAANRDLEGDGLLWILQPDESGLDASPKFEPVWGWRSNGRIGFPLLVRRNRRSASTPGGCASAATRCSARPWSTRCGRSRCRRWGGPRRPRRWSSGSGTSAAGSSSTRRSRVRSGPAPSPGPRLRRSPCPTCRRRSAAAWSRSTC